eukprot:PhM_4_TR5894/c4_g1_i2/m.67424
MSPPSYASRNVTSVPHARAVIQGLFGEAVLRARHRPGFDPATWRRARDDILNEFNAKTSPSSVCGTNTNTNTNSNHSTVGLIQTHLQRAVDRVVALQIYDADANVFVVLRAMDVMGLPATSTAAADNRKRPPLQKVESVAVVQKEDDKNNNNNNKMSSFVSSLTMVGGEITPPLSPSSSSALVSGAGATRDTTTLSEESADDDDDDHEMERLLAEADMLEMMIELGY